MIASRAARIAIVGGGPSGLIAAEVLAAAGYAVTVYERMPSPLRKFLLAGRGGLNLTHSEPLPAFLARYPAGAPHVPAAINTFPPQHLRDWSATLGEPTIIGTSGRIFPQSFKATPLVRAWLKRLATQGVRMAYRHMWLGWSDEGALHFATPDGPVFIRPDATLLALGGASWPRLGADGSWQPLLRAAGVEVAPFTPSNVGIRVGWTADFIARNAGAPLKGMAFSAGATTSRAEAVVTATGLEGGAIYALSADLRSALAAGAARLTLDMKPDVSADMLARRIAAHRSGETLSNLLRKLRLGPVAPGLLREVHPGGVPRTPDALATAIKTLALPVTGLAGIDRAISSAGGISFAALDGNLMLKARPGVFAAGEMLDWDAPTGGYLLQASFATGVAAARGIMAHLAAVTLRT